MRLRANRLTRRQLGLAGLAGLTLLAGCGGGADRTKARLRLVNATTGYEALDLVVDGDRRFSSVAYGDSDRYVEVDPADTDSELRRPGAAVALLTFTPSLAEDRDFTVLAYGGEGELATLLLDDNFGEPDNDKTRLRVVNAAPDAGTLDVYITGSDESLDGAVPVQAGAAVGSVGSFTTLSSGTRRLRITAAGSKTDVRLDVTGFVLGSEDVSTLVIAAGVGGVLVKVLRLDQQGDVARYDTPQARVRVAAGWAGGGVSVSFAGEDFVLGTVNTVSDYTLVPAGSLSTLVTVGGGAAVDLSTTLEAGSDNTLLVWGASGEELAAAWIGDDNRRPDDVARAKVRLVHGLADVSDALSLQVDGRQVASAVTAGTASLAGTPVPAAAAADLLVLSASTQAVILTDADLEIVANACYSVFVLGSNEAPSGRVVVMRQDR